MKYINVPLLSRQTDLTTRLGATAITNGKDANTIPQHLQTASTMEI
jgi:hypothetical protein